MPWHHIIHGHGQVFACRDFLRRDRISCHDKPPFRFGMELKGGKTHKQLKPGAPGPFGVWCETPQNRFSYKDVSTHEEWKCRTKWQWSGPPGMSAVKC